jgi:chromosome partitioning protein
MTVLQKRKSSARSRSTDPSPSPAPTVYQPTPDNPLVIAVTNLKGGVAKTTTAVHFAEYLRQFGETVLVDSDPNRSAIAWAGRTAPDNNSFRVINEIQLARYSGKACCYIIDTKARPDVDDLKALIDTATLIVLPTTTSGDDLRVTAQTAHLLTQVGSTIHRALITKAPTQAGSTDILEAKKFLETEGVPVFNGWIRQYKVYQYAFLEGVPVCCVKNPKAHDAWTDYQAVMQEVLCGN